MFAADFREGWQFIPPTGNTRNVSFLENQSAWQQPQLYLRPSHTLYRVNSLALSPCNKAQPSARVSAPELLLQCTIDITGRSSALSNIIHRVKSHCWLITSRTRAWWLFSLHIGSPLHPVVLPGARRGRQLWEVGEGQGLSISESQAACLTWACPASPVIAAGLRPELHPSRKSDTSFQMLSLALLGSDPHALAKPSGQALQGLQEQSNSVFPAQWKRPALCLVGIYFPTHCLLRMKANLLCFMLPRPPPPPQLQAQPWFAWLFFSLPSNFSFSTEEWGENE